MEERVATRCDFRNLGVLGAGGALACGPMQPVVVHGRVVVPGSIGTNLAMAAGGVLLAGLIAYVAPTLWWESAVLVLLSVPFIRRAVTRIRAARGHVAPSVIVVDDAGAIPTCR